MRPLIPRHNLKGTAPWMVPTHPPTTESPVATA